MSSNKGSFFLDIYRIEVTVLEDKIRRVRPKKEESINGRLEIRIGPKEQAALNHMVIESDRTKSDIIRRALMLYYKVNKGKW